MILNKVLTQTKLKVKSELVLKQILKRIEHDWKHLGLTGKVENLHTMLTTCKSLKTDCKA